MDPGRNSVALVRRKYQYSQILELSLDQSRASIQGNELGVYNEGKIAELAKDLFDDPPIILNYLANDPFTIDVFRKSRNEKDILVHLQGWINVSYGGYII